MKRRTLILLVLLASGFVQEYLIAADSPVAAAISADGDASGAAASSGSSIHEGPLAKIALLHGTLCGVPEPYRGATLVHGAMLWEMGIIKSLYTMLITPKNKERRLVGASSMWSLGNVLNELFTLAGEFMSPVKSPVKTGTYLTPTILGQLYKVLFDGDIDQRGLQQLLSPAEAVARPILEASALQTAQRKGLSGGQLEVRTRQNIRQLFGEISANNNKLTAALASCIADKVTPQLRASVILAFFWAKFVMGVGGDAISVAAAAAAIRAFMAGTGYAVAKAAGGDALTASSALGESSDDKVGGIEALEEKAIGRIAVIYKNDMPNPPKQAWATLLDKSNFADCGECGSWALILAALYQAKEQGFVIPSERLAGFYDPGVVDCLLKYPTVAAQDTAQARNARAEVISHRRHLEYGRDGFEIVCDFQNIMCLLAQLVPAVYDEFCTTCGCAPVPIADRDAHIEYHFTTSPACAEKMLEAFAQAHGLFVSDVATKKDDIEKDVDVVEWRMSRKEPAVATCFLAFSTKPKHMDCTLQGAEQDDGGQLNDLLLGCSDALNAIPTEPDKIQPIIFAAARMVWQKDFFASYLALLPYFGKDGCVTIAANLRAWGKLGDEDREILDRSRQELLCDALCYGLTRTGAYLYANGCRYKEDLVQDDALNTKLMELNRQREVPLLFEIIAQGHFTALKLALWVAEAWEKNDVESGKTLLMCAAENNQRKIANYLLKLPHQNINAKDHEGKTALMYAAQQDALAVVRFLCSKGALVEAIDHSGMTALMHAAYEGCVRTVRYLCTKAGATVEAVDRDGSTALIHAATEGCFQVVRYLCEVQHANVNAAEDSGATALMYAADQGFFEIVKCLVEHGADIEAVTGDGETALSEARNAGHADIVEYLSDVLLARTDAAARSVA